MQGIKTITPKMMYQVHLDDLVPLDNFYRRLNSEFDLNFLYKATEKYYGTEGQESIDPVVFFKICLIGYLNNINSDRRIIEYCSNCFDVRLYLQYDIDEKLPWHSTISRTRQLYGEEVFLSLFKKVLSLCVQKGMVRGKRQAIDSAFIKANASMESLVDKGFIEKMEKEVMEDVGHYAEELNEHSEYKSEGTEQGDKTKQTAKPEKSVNLTRGSLTDPDARISVKPGKVSQLNYSGQIAVDDAHHVITGAMADFADKRDSQSLPGILGQTIDNLKEENITIEQVTADTNYSSGEALRFVEENNIDGYIPNIGGYKAEREGFIYNEEKDQYECQRGNKAILPFRKLAKSRNSQRKIYRSTKKDCKDCPFLNECITKSKHKVITDSIDKPLYDKMHQKMNTPKAKHILKKRSSTVEPVLGTLINFVNMKRVNTRGIELANKHVLMAALTYNLKKYMKFTKFTPKKAEAMIISINRQIGAISNQIFALKSVFGGLNLKKAVYNT
jgi:transposase